MSPLFEADIHHYLDIETCVAQRQTYNGTAPSSVARQCTDGKQVLATETVQTQQWDKVVSSVYELIK